MANILLKARLALELPPINAALERAAQGLPEPVRPVARHIFEAGGKRLRPLLTVLTARLLGYERADIYDLAVTMEMLHAATLLHDDVLDNAVSRRGKPAAGGPGRRCKNRKAPVVQTTDFPGQRVYTNSIGTAEVDPGKRKR